MLRPSGSADPLERIGEHGPYLVCLVAAALLRLHDLGRVPLSPAEAAASWAAWSTAVGGTPVVALLDRPPESAALFGLQHAIFWFAGGSDVLARLGPALLGASIVVLPWLGRRALGRVASIALAGLLAFDPLLVGYSRLADGTAVTVASTWALIVGSGVLAGDATLGARGLRRWLFGTAVAAGWLAVSGPLAWDLLPPLVVTLVLFGRTAHGAGICDGRWYATAAATALLVATSGLAQWQGPPLVSAGAGAWLRQWLSPGGTGLPELWSSLLAYEMLPVALGLAGVILGLAGARDEPPAGWRFPLFTGRGFVLLTAWLLWGCLVSLRAGRTPSAWLVMQPPLLLAASYAAHHLVSSMRERVRIVRRTAVHIAVAALIVLVVRFVHGGFEVANDGHGGRFRPHPVVSEPAVRLLAQDVASRQRQSRSAAGPPRLEVVSPRGADPLLAWYLRGRDELRWVAAPSRPAAGDRRVLIEPIESRDGGPVPDGYPVRRVASRLERVALR